MRVLRTILFSLCFFPGLFLTAGCDTGDSDDGTDPDEVAGIYLFTEYHFVPDGAGFSTINVLDTLDAGFTELLLTSDGDFQLRYRFVDGGIFHADGSFTVRPSRVTLTGDPEDAADFERLLLDRTFTLRRDEAQPDILQADIRKRINPSAFSDRYAGVEQMDGVLHLKIERQ